MEWYTVSLFEHLMTSRPIKYRRPEIDLLTWNEIGGRVHTPIIFGQEIEQDKNNLDDKLINTVLYNRGGHWESGGPFEWNYGPYRFPIQLNKLLYKDTENYRYIWEWTNKVDLIGGGYCGCGSHIHFSLTNHYNNYIYWTYLWNTLNDIAPFLMPLYIFTPKVRRDFFLWAKYIYRRLTPRDMTNILSRSLRCYEFITPNPENVFIDINGEPQTNKPFTIEMRAPEAHPVFISTFQRMISTFMQNVLKYGTSPKISEPYMVADIINSLKFTLNVYSSLSSTPYGLEFERPLHIFDYPELQKKVSYHDGLHFFLTMCYYFLSMYPEEERNKDYFWRCLWFVYNGGNQRDEPWENLWNVYIEDEFEWETVPNYTGYLPKPEEMRETIRNIIPL